MGVLVPLAVTEFLHKFGGGVAYDRRHRFGQHGQRVLFRALVRHVKGVGLGRDGHIHHRLGKVHAAFGHAYKVARLVSRHGDFQRPGVCKSYILACEPYHPARDIKRIFARFQHTRQPVHSRVGVGIAHGLVQGGYEIVMLLARLVVQKRFAGSTAFHRFRGDGHAVFVLVAVEHRHFQRGQRAARVPVCENRYHFQAVLRYVHLHIPEAARVGYRPLQKLHNVLFRKRLQHEHFTAGKQCAVHFKRRIFRGCAY